MHNTNTLITPLYQLSVRAAAQTSRKYNAFAFWLLIFEFDSRLLPLLHFVHCYTFAFIIKISLVQFFVCCSSELCKIVLSIQFQFTFHSVILIWTTSRRIEKMNSPSVNPIPFCNGKLFSSKRSSLLE